MGSVGSFTNLCLVAFVAAAMVYDVKERRIPNWLIGLAVVLGTASSAWVGVERLKESLLGLGLGIGLLIIPFALGWLGGGDVKFLGAVGSIIGVDYIPRVFFYTALAGLVIGLGAASLRGITCQVFKNAWGDLKLLFLTRGEVLPEPVTERISKGAQALPYGVAIGLGAVIAYFGDPRGEWAGF